MLSKELISTIKKELSDLVTNLDESNVHSTCRSLGHYIGFLENGHALHLDVTLEAVQTMPPEQIIELKNTPYEKATDLSFSWLANNDDEVNSFSSKHSINPKSIIQEKNSPRKKQGRTYIGKLNRQLKGGFLAPHNNVYVPESVIRSQGLNHNDSIEATLLFKTPETKRNKYDYRVIERANNHDGEKRLQLNHCIVKYDPTINRFYFDSTLDDTTISHQNKTMKFLLNDWDTEPFFIKEGDIIDYAFFENDCQKGRICWKHGNPETIKDGNHSFIH